MELCMGIRNWLLKALRLVREEGLLGHMLNGLL